MLSNVTILDLFFQLTHLKAWLLNLIPHLATMIQESDNADNLLMAAISTLSNLCRNNPVAITVLRDIGCHKVRYVDNVNPLII